MTKYKLQSGYSYSVILSNTSWQHAKDEKWETEMAVQSDIDNSAFVGNRRIDGSEVAVFFVSTIGSPNKRKYFAQTVVMCRVSE